MALSGSEDKTLRLWDIESGQCQDVISPDSDMIWSVAFSPDDRFALFGCQNNTVQIWDIKSKVSRHVLKGHTSAVRSVIFSSDGRRVLSGSEDKTMRLWDLESGQCLKLFEGHTDKVRSLAFCPDNRRVLSGSEDKTMRLWDVESGECLNILEGHSGVVGSVALSPDGRSALSGSGSDRSALSGSGSDDGGTIRLWDLESGRCLRILKGHSSAVLSVAFSPNGLQAISGSQDGTMRLWATTSDRSLREFKGHAAPVWSVVFCSSGRTVLSVSEDRTIRLWEVESGQCKRVFEAHSDVINCMAFSPDGRRAYSGSKDKTIRIWDVESGQYLSSLKDPAGAIHSIAFAPDGRQALSGSIPLASDGQALSTIHVWDVQSGQSQAEIRGGGIINCIAIRSDGRRALFSSSDYSIKLLDVKFGRILDPLTGHSGKAASLAFSPDGRKVLAGLEGSDLILWDVETAAPKHLRDLTGHSGSIRSVAFAPDGRWAISGSEDKTVRLWDTESGQCKRVLEGHTGAILSVAISPNGLQALSGSDDKILRLWNIETGHCLREFKGHSEKILCVGFSSDGQIALSGAINGEMLQWEINESSSLTQPAIHDQRQYTNAKVILVGDSSAGKTGLFTRLALNKWEFSDSTVGALATKEPWLVPDNSGVKREIWLWDFGGQADQRLIHQLYMGETALAVLVFDGQKDDLFESLNQWDRFITRASGKNIVKILVAGRTDAGGLRASRCEIEQFAKDKGFSAYLETSAKTNEGCEALKKAIDDSINWDSIPCRTTNALFERLNEEILHLRNEGRALMRFNDLRDALRSRLTGSDKQFTDDQLKTVICLLAAPSIVWKLPFGDWILLQPERINAYAQAVIRTLRGDPKGLGCLEEEKVLKGSLDYASSAPRLEGDEERIILLAMHQMLVKRELCFRQPSEKGNLLVFPSFYRRDRPERMKNKDRAASLSYRFKGFLDEIYAMLVVSLHHTGQFKLDQLWRYAADFKTNKGLQVEMKLTRRAPDEGELELYFDPAPPMEEKIICGKYIHEFLEQHAQEVNRFRLYLCQCNTQVSNREVAMKRLNGWLLKKQKTGEDLCSLRSEDKDIPSILCVNCEQRIPLWDMMERAFYSSEIQKKVRTLRAEANNAINNDGQEGRIAEDIISTINCAGHDCKKSENFDLEIEFTDDSGKPNGMKAFILFKESNQYIRLSEDQKGKKFFTSKRPLVIDACPQQQCMAVLIIRHANNELYWMDVSSYLQAAFNTGETAFEGYPFNLASMVQWKSMLLEQFLENNKIRAIEGDPEIRRRSIDNLLNSSLDNRTQEFLFQRGRDESNVEIRFYLIKKLGLKNLNIRKTREFLKDIAEKDSSEDVCALACETIFSQPETDGDQAWKLYAERKWLRERSKKETKISIKQKLKQLVDQVGRNVSRHWEAKLSGQSLPESEREPETLPGYPAFRVYSFRLAGIRPFEDTKEIRLQPKLNVLLGDNTVGKTTILRCLALAAVGFAAVNEIEDHAVSYLRKGAERGTIEVIYELLPDPDSSPNEAGYVAAGLQIASLSSRFEPIPNDGMTLCGPNPDSGKSDGKLPNCVTQLGKLRSSAIPLFGFVFGYGAARNFSQPPKGYSDENNKAETNGYSPSSSLKLG